MKLEQIRAKIIQEVIEKKELYLLRCTIVAKIQKNKQDSKMNMRKTRIDVDQLAISL